MVAWANESDKAIKMSNPTESIYLERESKIINRLHPIFAQTTFARTKFARPCLPNPKFAQTEICSKINLPRPIFAQAKFAQTHICPSQICLGPNLPQKK